MLRNPPMKPVLALLLAPALLLLMAARQAPLVEAAPIAVPAGVSVDQVKQIVGNALVQRGWRVVKSDPGVIVAIYDPREFSVTIAVHYDAQKVQINYVTSHDLRYEIKNGRTYIHKNYNSWIKNLGNDISSAFVLTH